MVVSLVVRLSRASTDGDGRERNDAMEDEDDPAMFWPLFETTVNDEAEFGEDVGFVRDSTRCDAMRCDEARSWVVG